MNFWSFLKMIDVDLRLSVRPYDHLTPLFLGNVPTPGVKLHLNQATDLMETRTRLLQGAPEGFDAAEVSFNRYAAGKANGDTSLVGIPAFILRNFRHRCWYVRHDSPLESLKDLKGKRVGTDSWNDTGTMWSRAAMRDAGVQISDVKWTLGKLAPHVSQKPATPETDSEPAGGAERLPEGEYLLEALEAGRIDAITTAATPEGIYQQGGKVRRLLRNYRAVEAEYKRRNGFRPGLHIIAVRRDFAEQHPDSVLTLYKALRDTWPIWWAKLKRFGDATPWAAEEVETMIRDFADEMPPYGMESPAHQKMVASMCKEQFEQQLVPKLCQLEDLFGAFDALHRSAKAAA
ncbi:ABC transporter substrate-binding protein [Microvirga brassicacearum]|uniref:Nitrate ABC transporter substrate-binding protein n=1 Tax=Microvirga brassicacearum TaxID=2580413 RepID=A0A5N3PAL9_9HYPH|nr:ABC transporter substrate-binding protein [Microvirga brassicacearum]KAB0266806.1 nitrate ABC transporter substrate-binding protein [Microvirga brassicacearum]